MPPATILAWLLDVNDEILSDCVEMLDGIDVLDGVLPVVDVFKPTHAVALAATM